MTSSSGSAAGWLESARAFLTSGRPPNLDATVSLDLWIDVDDLFEIRGRGTVVTGALGGIGATRKDTMRCLLKVGRVGGRILGRQFSAVLVAPSRGYHIARFEPFPDWQSVGVLVRGNDTDIERGARLAIRSLGSWDRFAA